MPLLVIQSPATYSHAQHSPFPLPPPWKKLAEKTNVDVVNKDWNGKQPPPPPYSFPSTVHNWIPSKYMTTTSELASSS